MKIVSHLSNEKWNEIVKSFYRWDVYYLCEYAISLMNHEGGIPLLFFYEDENCKVCFTVMLKDIANAKQFRGALQENKYFDMETPYGYGGPMVEGDFNKESKHKFMCELKEYCVSNKIVTQFIRFHPIYQNQKFCEEFCEIASLKETIVVDTSSEEIIMQNMDSKNRNMVRKAKKSGVIITKDKGERLDDFIKIYESTMDKNCADDYYYFEKAYYEYLQKEMKDNVIFFYAYIDDVMIGASIFFYNNNFMHYHLSGALKEYRNMASTNLLLYEAALWGANRGIKYLHLGGGINNEDTLFGFKKQFNKNGHLPYYIGKNIFDYNSYSNLLQIRKDIDLTFDTENSYFIQYRK